jgi:2-polyprenyl-6-methoxyphenol hydroxylase-like FAD-dependent oxidoreductase
MDDSMTTSVRTRATAAPALAHADICVLGAGISGVCAALEAARLGRRVVLVDGAPALGGQAIGSIIGTIIGLYSHGPRPYQLTHGIADELIGELEQSGALHRRQSARGTFTFQYDVVQLGRWIERKVEEAGITVLLGAILTEAPFVHGRVEQLRFATRFGTVTVVANGYVDASGDASLCWQAGLEVREPDTPAYGSLNFLLEGFDEQKMASFDHHELYDRLAEVGHKYGLVRHDGFLFSFPGKGFALANITHIPTPLDPLLAASTVFAGRKQADSVVQFLKDQYPDIFQNARVRAYGNPGLRQTRWIVGRHQLTLDEIRSGVRPGDAVVRCAWSVELHDKLSLVHWEEFGPDHMHYIPLGSMLPRDAENIVATGCCIDADPYALSSVRVMGPCIGMGAAAAHSLDLAGAGSVQKIDIAELQRRLYDNLERTD